MKVLLKLYDHEACSRLQFECDLLEGLQDDADPKYFYQIDKEDNHFFIQNTIDAVEEAGNSVNNKSRCSIRKILSTAFGIQVRTILRLIRVTSFSTHRTAPHPWI